MSERRTPPVAATPGKDEAEPAARKRPVLPPPALGQSSARSTRTPEDTTTMPAQPAENSKKAVKAEKSESPEKRSARKDRPLKAARPAKPRQATLRVVQVDAWSVMKTAFLLSLAIGIVTVVAVAVVWGVLGAAGVWDSINSVVAQSVGNESGTPFDIQDYLSTSRILGFTLVVAVADVILITVIATLGAFLYNLSAILLGGIEVTLEEEA